MPGFNYAPRFAIAAGFDASPWAGETVYTRGGTDVDIPSTAGVYEDALVFLNGLGSNKDLGVSLGSSFDANWTGPAGTGTIYIDADDLVTIEHTGGAFTLTGAAGNAAFGLPTSNTASTFVDGTNRVTATSNWTRGVIQAPNLNIDPDGAGAAFNVMDSDGHTVQSIPTLLRWHNQGDADELAADTNLEYLDHDAAGEDTVRWGINAEGHVFVAREDGMGGAFAWGSTTFRDRLGFSGRETEVVTGDAAVLTADNPLPGFIVPQRPMMELIQGYGHQTSAKRLRSGQAASSEIADWITYRLSSYLGGSADPDNDETFHWRAHVLPYIRPGAYVTIYQEWGDPRRARYQRVRASGDEPYSILYTSEFNGRRGRLRCIRSPDDNGAFEGRFASAVRLRFQVELLLEERKD